MPDSLWELLEMDREASQFFESLPMFAQDQLRSRGRQIKSREDMSALAHTITHDSLLLEQYKPMFEDETDSKSDLV